MSKKKSGIGPGLCILNKLSQVVTSAVTTYWKTLRVSALGLEAYMPVHFRMLNYCPNKSPKKHFQLALLSDRRYRNGTPKSSRLHAEHFVKVCFWSSHFWKEMSRSLPVGAIIFLKGFPSWCLSPAWALHAQRDLTDFQAPLPDNRPEELMPPIGRQLPKMFFLQKRIFGFSVSKADFPCIQHQNEYVEIKNPQSLWIPKYVYANPWGPSRPV